MKRMHIILRLLTAFALLLGAVSLTGCAAETIKKPATTTETEPNATETTPSLPDGTEQTAPQSAIPFADGQLYAVAYAGFDEPEALDTWVETYLNGERPETVEISEGEYYLVIPRNPGTMLRVLKEDFDTGEKSAVYEDPDGKPVILHCNASDIFFDATVELTDAAGTVSFTPYISPRDGAIEIGEHGLLLTK